MITLLGVVGCQLSEDSDPVAENSYELRKALRENLYTPLGELKRILAYQGQFSGRSDYYYDQNDNVSLIFGLNETGNDTLSVQLHFYNDHGQLITKNFYNAI